MVLLNKVLEIWNHIQLTKNKIDLNNRTIKNHPPPKPISGSGLDKILHIAVLFSHRLQ